MSKYKRVWAMLGVVGILGALLALATAAAPISPAGASVPNNTINLTKIVSGTVPPQYVGQPFVIQVQCAAADADFNPVTPDVPFSSGSAFNQDGTPIGGSNVVSISGAYTNCVSFESQTLGAGDGAGPNNVLVQGFGDPSTNVSIAAGNDGTVPSSIVFDGTGSDSATLIYINQYPPATFNTVRVVKQTTGIVPANAIFQIDVTCDPPPAGPPIYTASAVFVGGGGSQDVLVPSTCSSANITEVIAQPAPDSGDVNGIPLPGPATVNFAPGSGQVRNVTVTNNYGGPVNTVTIRKTVVGTPPPGVTYAGTVTCTDSGPGPDITRNWAFGSGGGTTQLTFPSQVGVITQGETCTAIETVTGGTANVTTNVFPVIQGVVLAQFSVVGVFGWANGNGGHTATVEHVNRFLPGPQHTITVTKNVTGQPPAGTLFIVRIICNYDTDGPSGPAALGDPFFLAFGEGLPTSQSFNTVANSGGCVIQETNSGGASSRSFAVGSASPPVTALAQQDLPPPGAQIGGIVVAWNTTTPSQVTGVITNRFHDKPLADNVLRIKKQLRGRIPAGATFDIRVRCTGQGITDVFDLTFSSNSFQEIAVPYNRSNCVVKELTNGGAQSVSYFASSATADATDGPNSGRVDFGTTVGGQRGKVIVRNQFPGTCPRPGPKFC